MLADGITTMYGLDRAPVDATGDPGHPQLAKVFGELAGASFGGGLYRVHTPDLARAWTGHVEAFFPEFRGRVACFGYDWLGRQFALDRQRREGARFMVLLLEPGTGDALEIPASVAAFHTDVLVQEAEAALALTFYADWRESSGDDAYLGTDECVGYTQPLFAGGADDVGNLARTGMEAYWSSLAGARNGG